MATTEEVPGGPKYRRAWAAGRLNTIKLAASFAAAHAAPQPGGRNVRQRASRMRPARGLVLLKAYGCRFVAPVLPRRSIGGSFTFLINIDANFPCIHFFVYDVYRIIVVTISACIFL
jgi:hypothetical protein